MAGTVKEEAIVLALKAMTLLPADSAPKVELLSDRDQRQTYKVCAEGRPLLVRSSNKERCAAAHFYATTAARHVPGFRPKMLGCDVERGLLVEEWLDPGEYKSLAHELLQEPASYGWSTPFREGEFSEIDLEEVLHDVGQSIGKIHAGAAGFAQSARNWEALKPSETYLRAARAHPHLANRLHGIAEESSRVEPVLLHGSLSPSSVLFSEKHVAIVGADHIAGGDPALDSEKHVAIVGADHVAAGDPALDLAHMMAHLFIASVHRGSSILVTSAGAFHSGYAGTIEGLDKLSIMQRAGPLAVAFMLACLEDEQLGTPLTSSDKEVILDFSQWWLGRRDYALGQVRYALWDAVDLGGAVDWRATFESLPRASD